MKAPEAHKLKVGDWVSASFGCHYKKCEIIGIRWPKFDLRTKDHRGDEMIRDRHYHSISGPVAPASVPSVSAPSWLEWPANDES